MWKVAFLLFPIAAMAQPQSPEDAYRERRAYERNQDYSNIEREDWRERRNRERRRECWRIRRYNASAGPRPRVPEPRYCWRY